MNGPPSVRDGAPNLEQVGYWRHELITPVNHILGLTEIQIDEAPETGLRDHVPAFEELNARGRTLLAIIEDEFELFSGPSSFKHLETRIQSQAEPGCGEARKLAEQLRKIGSETAAEEVALVSSAFESLLAIVHEMVRSESKRDLCV